MEIDFSPLFFAAFRRCKCSYHGQCYGSWKGGTSIGFEFVLKSGNAVCVLSFLIHWTNQYQQRHCSKLAFFLLSWFHFIKPCNWFKFIFSWFLVGFSPGCRFKTADDMIENYSHNCSGIPQLWVGIIFLFFYVFGCCCCRSKEERWAYQGRLLLRWSSGNCCSLSLWCAWAASSNATKATLQ